jgi:molybdopterin biosynthesis enzyme
MKKLGSRCDNADNRLSDHGNGSTFHAGDNISYQGEDAKKGSSLLKKGTKITPGVTALFVPFFNSELPFFASSP